MRIEHDYKLADFRIFPITPKERVTGFTELIVTLHLKDMQGIPNVLLERIERDMNKTLSDYEEEINQEIPLDKVDFEVTLEADVGVNKFFVGIYLGCDLTNDGMDFFDYLNQNDADYAEIKTFYFDELTKYAAARIDQIRKSVEQ
jgi:hypothetical protein